jgi:thioesterase domain-containing protein
VQPKGPYLLGGHCVGGVVAFEMAQQLTREGEEVRLLALLDTQRPTAVRGFVANLRHPLLRVAHMIDVISQLLDSRDRSSIFSNLIHRKLKRGPAQSPQQVLTDRLYQLRIGYRRLTYRYTAQPYSGRITLIVNEKQYRFDKDLGWKGVSKGGFDAHPLPGDHHTVLSVHGKEFAELIRKCIDKAFPESVAQPERSRTDAA